MLLLECSTMCGFAFQPQVDWTRDDDFTRAFFTAWTLELPLPSLSSAQSFALSVGGAGAMHCVA